MLDFPKPNTAKLSHPIVLCVLDGWGEGDEHDPSNAIARAKTPNWNHLLKIGFKSSLEASQNFVGLPEGQMGNSEVGHLTLGAGRVILQDLPRINQAILHHQLLKNPALSNLIEVLQKNKKPCHLMGLFSPGGVHSHMDHLRALILLLNKQGIPIYLHLFLDGRDTPPNSALGFYEAFFEELPQILSPESFVHVATLSGRFYAMDRDKRWARVHRAYDAIVHGMGSHSSSAMEAIEISYAQEITDEFVIPTVIGDYTGIHEGDGLLCFNFRADRVREILEAILDPDFREFNRKFVPQLSCVVGMTEYSEQHNQWLKALFPQEKLHNLLGDVISHAGLNQLRLAETEKYAHVTFFFNGGREVPFPEEYRKLIPSPKVNTYDMQPEMSAIQVTDVLIQALQERRFDVYIVNFANADMVGHTGNLMAGIKAVEALDQCFKRILTIIQATKSILLITADHGNIEQMEDLKTHTPLTSHTCFKVPFVLVNAPKLDSIKDVKDGTLADVAPTILDLLNLPKPIEMTGHSLLIHEK